MPKGFESMPGNTPRVEQAAPMAEFHDVHESAVARKELLEAEERYKDVLQQISDLNNDGGMLLHPLRSRELKQQETLALEALKRARMHDANEAYH